MKVIRSGVPPLAPQVGRRETDPPRQAWLPAMMTIAGLAVVSVVAAQMFDYRPNPRITPTRAVTAVKASGKTHLLNSYDFGGYLIAQGLKPFIDGRTELYGEAFVMRHDRAVMLHDVGGFLHLLRDNRIDVTLLAPGTPAVGLLDRLKGWQRVYADGVAVVHVRTSPASADELR